MEIDNIDVGTDSIREFRTHESSELQSALKALKGREEFGDDLLGELIALAFAHPDAKVRSKAKVFCKAQLNDYEDINGAFKALTRHNDVADEALAKLDHRLSLFIARAMVFHAGIGTGTAFMLDAEVRKKLLELNVAYALEHGKDDFLSLQHGIGSMEMPRFFSFNDNALADISEAAQRVNAHRLIVDNQIHCEDLPLSFSCMAGWLTHLSAGNASLTTMPAGLLACKKLEVLELWGVDLTDMPDLSVLPALKKLSLFRALKFKTLPEGVTASKTIEDLDFGESKIAKIPATISQMSSLKTLKMHGVKVKKLPKEITECVSLKSIFASNRDKLDIAASKKLFEDAGKTIEWRVY